jgi:DNA-binding transcriptional MerR regulator
MDLWERATMHDTTDHHTPASTPVLKMKDLVAATGVARSTILYYVQQGMLPEPVKTSRNMAYYDPACIDIIRFIQEMQRRHRLSLEEIKQVINARGSDADFPLYLALKDVIFGASAPDDLLDLEAFCAATGLTPDQVMVLLKTRLLMPLDEGLFDADDIRMGQMFFQAFAWGMCADDLTFYVELGEQIIAHEFALKRKITHDLPYDEDAVMALEMVKNARLGRAYILDRLFQHRIAAMRDLKDEDEEWR